MRGPIDFVVVGFEGKSFDGSILKTLAEPIQKGIIKVLALTAIRKDAKGAVQEVHIANTKDKITVTVETSDNQTVIAQEDIDEVADLLENNTSAALLIIEQLWAKPLKKAIMDAKGVLVAEGRIHPEAAAGL